MTLTQLKREVAALCFDKSVIAATDFCFFANRALRKIFSDRGVTKRVKLNVSQRAPSRRVDTFIHRGGDSVSFSTDGGAYALETSGEGYFTVKDGDGERKYEFNSDFTAHKGFLKGKATLTFSGEYTYTVVKIDFFNRCFGSDVESIPDGGKCLDLNEIYHDLGCIVALPQDSDGMPIPEATVEDGRITLPEDFSGNIFVTYLRSPTAISEDTPDKKIDVSEDAVHLLPLLCASYLSLECDPERAEGYAALYKEEMAALTKKRRRISTAYIVGDGWS